MEIILSVETGGATPRQSHHTISTHAGTGGTGGGAWEGGGAGTGNSKT